MSERACVRCATVKPLALFAKGARKDGTHSYCLDCMSEYKRKRYAANPEPERERCRAYNKANPSVPREAMRRLRERDPVGQRERVRAWRSENPDRTSVYDAKKRAIRRGASKGGTVTAAQWSEIKRKHRHCCAYCGQKPKRLTMDHIIPLARGGKHEPDNIAPACATCNSRKHATHPLDFAQRVLGRLL
jgi:5-methylcytosine-specific restriction endonuclease McrA